MRDELGNCAETDSPEFLFYRGAIANKANQVQESIGLLQEYLKTAKPTDEKLIHSYELLGDSYVKNYQYNEAAVMFDLILKQFSDGFSEDKKHNIKYLSDLWRAAENVLPQTVSFTADTYLQGTRGKVPLLHIPVEINSQTIEFVFDCGADISSISVSWAKNLGLQIIETEISVSGASCRSNAKLGVAPVIKIGNVILENVIFLVLEDKDLNIEKYDYQIYGILGYSAIVACRQITINQKDEIFIPATIIDQDQEQNLLIDEMKPIFKAAIDNQPMTFFFDSGAVKTKFFPKFLESREGEIQRIGKRQSGSLTGVGGSRDFPAYIVDKLSFSAFGKILEFKDSVIFTVPAVYQSEYHYGNIGQDWINQFNRMTLDFRAMSIVFE